MYQLLETFFGLFQGSYRPPKKFFFDPVDYHPIHGFPGKVDRPKQNIRTYFGTKKPWIEHLNGPLDRHFVGTPLYQQAYEERKRYSYYNVDLLTQISKHAFKPIPEKRLEFLDGTTINSRDPYHSRRRSSFYSTARQ